LPWVVPAGTVSLQVIDSFLRDAEGRPVLA